ncbi:MULTISPECIES: hypothetical protein [Larkinella]|uniref:YtxH domain-containing protein n=1 Tax=Larkinella punicea TaxID=2315727 RepID=A0A368JJ41_9BACT|nr:MULTISPECIES: hypothetical protein [Larkinella]RCR66141.1 hypothetical protein DUE52_28695 [Larkinella punicea]
MKKYTNGWKGAGAILGALGGFLYWHEVGCLTGHCPIQSHWQTMTLWGGAMGFLMTDLLQQLLKNGLNRPEKSEK